MFGRMQLSEKIIMNLLLLILAAIWVIPMIYLVMYSFEGDQWGNYQAVVSLDLFPHFLINSFIVSTSVVLLLLIVVSLAAFGFSKLRFPGDSSVFAICLIGLMIPPVAMLVPLFQTVKSFHWMNTYLSLIGPEVAMSIPFSLLLARNAFDEVPGELLEAAEIDGSNAWGRFVHVMLPLAIPVLTTIGILAFLNSWNQYVLPLVFISKETMLTVTMAPKFFIKEYTSDYHKVFAALVLITVPVVILYIFGQKYMQRGLTSGAIK
ncbi:carbohydrate ABC transporter permease [Paenibacillus aceris]|uniref:ABC-type glycerol-3-phosphate transport system permease component n=1 Tax=Paenibacillus aceris TaxID=869555 RepID=A0ABS4I5M6_9BACL|nr:carbohydrate ABC transporter permease [Paenibacillus aceris]MBP1966226.1 ABC-type glycerol-3-phosphate transport system permease component [Paenibacillus aceris]NHW33379.1 carbohydrate ABC transporter permease [Paenibacillus aceris]